LVVQLRRAIDSFARADAVAGHPGSNSAEQTGPSPTQTAPGSGPSSSHGSSGSSAGLISGIVVVLVLLAITGPRLLRGVRRSVRAAHWRKEQSADAHAQADADLIKLGDDIGALDIDSSMPNASPQGKDEYAQAIECYQDAERRLHNQDDAYQFAQALDALKRGAQHMRAAEQSFGDGGARSTPMEVRTVPSRGPVPAPSVAVPGSAESSLVDQLTKLAALHDQGALTNAEFDAEKRKLLD
jgi:hypothetical protein